MAGRCGRVAPASAPRGVAQQQRMGRLFGLQAVLHPGALRRIAQRGGDAFGHRQMALHQPEPGRELLAHRCAVGLRRPGELAAQQLLHIDRRKAGLGHLKHEQPAGIGIRPGGRLRTWAKQLQRGADQPGHQQAVLAQRGERGMAAQLLGAAQLLLLELLRLERLALQMALDLAPVDLELAPDALQLAQLAVGLLAQRVELALLVVEQAAGLLDLALQPLQLLALSGPCLRVGLDALAASCQRGADRGCVRGVVRRGLPGRSWRAGSRRRQCLQQIA